MEGIYISPEGGGQFHIYIPEKKTCVLGGLRKALTRGKRADITLKPGMVVKIQPLQGQNKVKIVERTNKVQSTEHKCTRQSYELQDFR